MTIFQKEYKTAINNILKDESDNYSYYIISVSREIIHIQIKSKKEIKHKEEIQKPTKEEILVKKEPLLEKSEKTIKTEEEIKDDIIGERIEPELINLHTIINENYKEILEKFSDIISLLGDDSKYKDHDGIQIILKRVKRLQPVIKEAMEEVEFLLD